MHNIDMYVQCHVHPADPCMCVCMRRCDRARLEAVIRWLRGHAPYWDRSRGRDHVVWLTGDLEGMHPMHVCT